MESEGNASAARLLAEPFTFTQDELLSPTEFCKAAATRGIDVSLERLLEWHASGWLRPLLLIVESDDATGRVTVPSHRLAGRNFVGDAILAAGDGRLIDGETVLPDMAPYVPDRTGPLRSPWLFSSWQLLDLRSLPDTAPAPGDAAKTAIARRRSRTLLLCHGAAWALPGIMDSLRLPDGQETVPLWQAFANAADPTSWLTAVGWTPADIVKDAERLLLEAHWDDPNEEWLTLIRHMAPASWRRLRGTARDAIERRIAAEVLIALHDRLVQRSEAEPLPDIAAATSWHPLHDRLLGPELSRVPIEQALSRHGLSPHPRAVLLVEGESEAIAARLLLEQLATDSADWVRVHTLDGASNDPKMLARFVSAPALAAWEGDGWALVRPPTALVVHVDPEGRWDTETKATREQNAIVDALVGQVRRQGALIDRDVLAPFVRVDVAPERGFEYSNFSDPELADAVIGASDLAGQLDRDQLREKIADARKQSRNIDSVLGPLQVSKLRLATALAPVLIARLPTEVAEGASTPIIAAVLQAIDLATNMPRGSVVLPPPSDRAGGTA